MTSSLMKLLLYERSGALQKAFQALCLKDSVSSYVGFANSAGQSLDEAVESTRVTGIVAPGNSFGHMDGGLDKAISSYFGHKLGLSQLQASSKVQQLIFDTCRGYNPPTNALVLELGSTSKVPLLIHLPTMSTPMAIPEGDPVVFNCVWSLLNAVDNYNRTKPGALDTILVPALAAGFGKVTVESCACQIAAAVGLYHCGIQGNWAHMCSLDSHIRALAKRQPELNALDSLGLTIHGQD